MLKGIKEYIKKKPRLYDALDRFRAVEDSLGVWLQGLAEKKGDEVSFIQIGANDGLRWDPLRRFIVRFRWKGLLVEPIPKVFSMLVQNYAYLDRTALHFVNAAITGPGENDGLQLWTCRDEFLDSLDLEKQLYYLRKSSTDRAHLARYLPRREHLMEQVNVPAITLDRLIDQHWRFGTIDLLMIDVEGHEPRVLSGINFLKTQPSAIVFESHNLGQHRTATFDLLCQNGYEIRETEGDAIATLKPTAG